MVFYLHENGTVLIQIVVVTRIVDFIELGEIYFVINLLEKFLRSLALHFIELKLLSELTELA